MNNNKHAIGSITWFDLTVENAKEIKEFYNKVVGWKSVPVDMNGYDDYNMNIPDDNQTVAGICHAKGSNKDFPPKWLIYITVESIDKSIENCKALGGKLIKSIWTMSGYGRFCVIEDPAGAVCALFEPQK